MPDTICVDFDGTIVEHMYPLIGAEVPFAINTLKWLQQHKFNIILWTMRSGNTLQEAVDFVHKNGIKLYAVNENPDQRIWTSSPKALADVYIDDAALGCSLIMPLDGSRPFVDWITVRKLLKMKYNLS